MAAVACVALVDVIATGDAISREARFAGAAETSGGVTAVGVGVAVVVSCECITEIERTCASQGKVHQSNGFKSQNSSNFLMNENCSSKEQKCL